MAKNKLIKFAELDTFPNVLQPKYQHISENYYLRGKWSRAFFGNDNPVVLEIGCGKGEYTVGLARIYPDVNFVGIDLKGDRLWRGAKTAIENNIKNVAFLRVEVEKLEYFFAPLEVREIWITFPEPQLQKSRIKKRFTSDRFLNIYKKLLRADGIVHLKTDNSALFEFSVGNVEYFGCNIKVVNRDIHGKPDNVDDILVDIKTYYEQMFIKEGIPIKYLRFSMPQS
ncbi:MAG: tRNA (guanosine(46)-N7)-methyltransferase TrmB [Bacteroidales bacterium]